MPLDRSLGQTFVTKKGLIETMKIFGVTIVFSWMSLKSMFAELFLTN